MKNFVFVSDEYLSVLARVNLENVNETMRTKKFACKGLKAVQAVLYTHNIHEQIVPIFEQIQDALVKIDCGVCQSVEFTV